MEGLEALKTRRSIRRFSGKPIEQEKLDEICECVRFYPAAANLQSLKFVLLTDDRVDGVLAHLRWAGYLPDYVMGKEDMPRTLLLILGDNEICRDHVFSAGGAANQIMLAAHSLGLASCCLGMGEKAKEAILSLLNLDPERFSMLYAVALGYSDQQSRAVDQVESCKYTLDENGNFVVPKRRVGEIFLKV